ncbi:hypothetical protein B0920_21485 [Massilia sp. KIM]|uniref:glutathione S-transferase family protein n=1 Tax=Massilia sp. KIM TaxID=1955422 RepID=UPI00098F2B89|nr:glutathione binding-like protein [Massilia sp. KIM]OON59854.1 hypothetical protein B0920_21485 [Massilia sp. KIM]
MYTAFIADTPNGRKLTIALEEAGLDYRIRRVDLDAGEQRAPDFVRLSPNSKIPVLARDDGWSMFESCAILLHVAEASGKLLPGAHGEREQVLQWLFLQAASVGPMLGQLWWFRHAAPHHDALALDRYTRETRRLYGVLDARLATAKHVAGDDYGIADIAFYPWLATHEELGINVRDFPQVADWLHRLGERPALRRGMQRASEASHG